MAPKQKTSMWVKHYTNRTTDSPKSDYVEKWMKMLVSECNELAQNEYKKLRHDKVVIFLHWRMTYGFEGNEKYYKYFVEKEMRVLENDKVKILRDFSIQTETKTDHNKPDLILLEKKEKICYIVDVACPFDPRIEKKRKDKVKSHDDLKMRKNEVT